MNWNRFSVGAFTIVVRVANLLTCFTLENIFTKVGNPLITVLQLYMHPFLSIKKAPLSGAFLFNF
jgi:hypothetical protein